MKAERLAELICRPEQIKGDDLQELSTLVSRYPYFSAARILYLKALNKFAGARFRNVLKSSTVHIIDHKQLYKYLNDQLTFDYSAPGNPEKESGLSDVITNRIKEINGYIPVSSYGIPADKSPVIKTENKHNEDDIISINFNPTVETEPVKHKPVQPKYVAPAVSDSQVISNPIILDDIPGVIDDYSAVEAQPVHRQEPEQVISKSHHKYVIEPVNIHNTIDISNIPDIVEDYRKTDEQHTGKEVYAPLDLIIDEEEEEKTENRKRGKGEKPIFEMPEISGSIYQLKYDAEEEIPLSELAGQLKKKKANKNDIIDRFITRESGSIKITPDVNDMRDLSKEYYTEKEELFTETLAKIYIRQKLYEKAIATYIKLSLKYPEKSVYFANRIEKIKENINNKE